MDKQAASQSSAHGATVDVIIVVVGVVVVMGVMVVVVVGAEDVVVVKTGSHCTGMISGQVGSFGW